MSDAEAFARTPPHIANAATTFADGARAWRTSAYRCTPSFFALLFKQWDKDPSLLETIGSLTNSFAMPDPGVVASALHMHGA